MRWARRRKTPRLTSQRWLPLGDDREPLHAVDLAEDPRVYLALFVVGRRRDPELGEQSAPQGIVVLQQRLFGDQLSVVLDRLEYRATDEAEAIGQGLADSSADFGQRVEGSVADGGHFDPLAENLTRKPGPDGCDAGGVIGHGGSNVRRRVLIHGKHLRPRDGANQSP